jgi:antitoxin component YwqK of YwqJK toxin-antitoxin module
MKKLILYLFTLCSIPAFAQKQPDMGLYKVRINAGDKNISAEIKPVHAAPALETDRFYNWYSSNKISETQGGYSGTLLNGQYQEFYLNKNLKVQGVFEKGLKNGIWKEWTEDGILIRSLTWKKGIKQGEYEWYDEKGNLKQKGNYSNNVLNGRQFIYQNQATVEIANYKSGKLVLKKPSAHFWQKINIFKRKKSKPSNSIAKS